MNYSVHLKSVFWLFRPGSKFSFAEFAFIVLTPALMGGFDLLRW